MSELVSNERKKQDENPSAKSRIPQRTPQTRTKFYNKPKPLSAPIRDGRTPQPWDHSTRLPRATNTSRPSSGPNSERQIGSPRRIINANRNKGKPIVVPIIKQNEVLQCAAQSNHTTNEVNEEIKTGEVDLTISSCEEKLKAFEEMKIELLKRKKSIMKLYEIVNDKYENQELENILSDDLQDQSKFNDNICIKGQFSIGLKRLYSIPTNLVNTCEKILLKHKTITDWLESLSHTKELTKSNLIKKINEFNSENELLTKLLIDVKSEYLSEITHLLRNKSDDSATRKVRNKLNISELNCQYADPTQVGTKADGCLTFYSKSRIEELEKELEEQKFAKEALQIKYQENMDAMKELEDSLLGSREHSENLVLSLQKLQDENKSLQFDFDEKINKLNETITRNAQELSEAVEARDKYHIENRNLIKQMEDHLSSLQNMKTQIEGNVQKIVELEHQYDSVQKEKDELEKQVETLSVKLLETELRYKDLIRDVKEREKLLDDNNGKLIEYENTKINLRRAQIEIEEYAIQLQDKSEAFDKNEKKLAELLEVCKNLKDDLSRKEEYIGELENKQKQIALKRLQIRKCYSEEQMECYENQMKILKDQLVELQDEFEKIRNYSEVQLEEREAKLMDITKQNMDLTDTLKRQIEQKDIIIKELSKKERDQTSVICHLQHALEKKAQLNNNLNNELNDRKDEIKRLAENLEVRKRQVSQLKKIFIALDEPNRKLNAQRKTDQRKINVLQKKLAESQYDCSPKESKRYNEDIENIFNVIESELHFSPERSEKTKKHNDARTKLDKIEKIECHDSGPSFLRRDLEVPVGGYVKRVYLPNKGEAHTEKDCEQTDAIETSQCLFKKTKSDYNSDRLHRSLQDSIHSCANPDNFNIKNNTRNEKKHKMFKFARHQME